MDNHGNETCYSFDGIEYTENTKCPDSDSCCRTAEQCLPNRLCKSNGNPNIFVRATCINRPWTLATCAQICLYDNDTGFLPRVNVCSDGSYCCDNDPTCCLDRRGFFLDEQGVLIGRANATSTVPSSTATRTPTPAEATTTSSLASTTPVPSDASPGLSTGAKAGIAISVSIVALCAAFYLAFRLSRSRPRPPESQYFIEDKPRDIHYDEYHEMESNALCELSSERPVAELEADGGNRMDNM